MNDYDRLVEILNYDIETFAKNTENMTIEEALLITKIGNQYSVRHSSHPECLTLRNNLILNAIGAYKAESNFVLKAAQLQLIFSDSAVRDMVSDMNVSSRAYTFSTPESNVVMYDILSEKMAKVLNSDSKRLVK